MTNAQRELGGDLVEVQQRRRLAEVPPADRSTVASLAGEDLTDLRAAHVHARQLAAITDPTLVITGDRDELADLEQAARLYHAIPTAELAIVPGASHGAADRDIYWDLVLDFLDRRD